MLQRHSREWGEHVQELMRRGINPPRGGKDVGDHPPITPMAPARPSDLGGDAWRV